MADSQRTNTGAANPGSRAGMPAAKRPSQTAMPAAQRPSGSGIPPARPGSTRASMPTAPSARPERTQSVKKKAPMAGKELIIAGGVILILGVATMAMYMKRSKEKRDFLSVAEKKEAVFQENMKRAREAYEKAENVGKQYVKGKTDDKFNPETLNDPFKGTDSVYNVIWDRKLKDKKGVEKPESHALYPDRKVVEKIDRGEEKDGLSIKYGFAENRTIPIVIAMKNIRPDDGDLANLGGAITVIVKADKDAIFEAAMNVKAIGGAAEEKKDDKKADASAEKKEEAPAEKK